MKPTPLKKERGISMLVFGVPGSGKTRLLGSAADTLIVRPPTDHTASILRPGNCKEAVVSDWPDMLEVFQYLQQTGTEEHDWVWLDSISLFQDHGLDDVFQNAIDRKPERAKYGPDKGEYGINMDRISRWTRDMVGLANAGQFNFGITAHPFEWYDPVKQEDVWAPYIQGKNMSPKICGYMQVVAYLAVVEPEGKSGGEPKRVLMTDSPGFVGKNQLGEFPALKSGRHGIIDPTMDKVVDALQGRKASKKTTTRRKRRS